MYPSSKFFTVDIIIFNEEIEVIDLFSKKQTDTFVIEHSGA
jgi:hypothetical protein